ncbi:MAG: hypothetical protein L6R45_05935 [Anaerolineae bacterium]|nr:hypothetical protein [Anaerolineae bacterium]
MVKLWRLFIDSGLAPSEIEARKAVVGEGKQTARKPQPSFPKLKITPPSPIPKENLHKPKRKKAVTPPEKIIPLKISPIAVQALVIQIIPHHNGEVFLSKRAVDKNPEFFGWPFTGWTTPKKGSNKAYPQRIPDPIVNITVFNSSGEPIITHVGYGLNTVFYERRSEVRITVPQDVIRASPDDSIMVMKQAETDQPHDYDIEIYVPGSEQYNSYLAVCNQTMPSGGKATPRKFGWL